MSQIDAEARALKAYVAGVPLSMLEECNESASLNRACGRIVATCIAVIGLTTPYDIPLREASQQRV